MDLAEVVGRLTSLRRFPVEPLAGDSPDSALLRDGGLFGDRAFEVCDRATGRTLEATSLLLSYSARYMEDLVAEQLDRWTRVRIPEGREFLINDADWIADLSQHLGRPVCLKLRRDPAVVRLLARPTLRLAERTYGTALEPTRLRANLFVEITDGKPFAEDQWIGQSLRIGEALLEVTGGSSQSVLFFPGESGDADLLRGLASVHGHLGLDLRAVGGTRVRVGDPVVLVG